MTRSFARSGRLPVGAVLACFLAVAPGCGYTLRPPVEPTVKTVYVPIIQGNIYQRDLNIRLTEAVIKQIETRTPFKVVGSPEGADTTLAGLLYFADKNTVLENPNNLPRQLTTTLSCYVRWSDNRDDAVKRSTDVVAVTENDFLYPELGETAQATGYQKVIDRMARDIVDMMETPW